MTWRQRLLWRARGLGLRLRFLVGRGRAERDMDEELRFHLEQEIEANLRAGMPPAQARRAALLAFGGTDRFKEQVREARGIRPLEELLQDLRFGVRQLRKNPGFTAVAVLTLALGIGANTTVFTLIHSLILDPLPIPAGDRTVQLWREGEQLDRDVTLTPTRPMLAAWREEARSFEAFAAFDEAEIVWQGEGGPENLRGANVSEGLLEWFGGPPLLGRFFTPDDAQLDGAGVAILSQALWEARFGADPEILGRVISLDEEPFEVVGVMPHRVRRIFEAGFFVEGEVELWTPLPAETDGTWSTEPFILARLREGVGVEEALAELEVIQARLEYGGVDAFDWRPRIITPADALDEDLRTSLWVLFGAVGLVLLIACVNMANLLLARDLRRDHELALRRSLGARWGRLARQRLTENLLLSFLGAGLGLLLAVWTLDGVGGMLSGTIPELRSARLDPAVLLFTTALVVGTALLFGLAPALRSRRAAPGDLLREGNRRGGGGRGRGAVADVLVVVEVALALVLFLGSGLLVHSLRSLLRVEPGFETENLVAVSLSFPEERYPDNPTRVAFWEDLVERVSRLPRIDAVTWSRSAPTQVVAAMGTIQVEGRDLDTSGANPIHGGNWVSPEFFRTIGLSFVEGGTFSAEHMANPAAPVIVNRNVMDRYFPGGGAVGKRIQLRSPFDPDRPSPWLDIVGVVENVKGWSLDDDPDRFQLYLPVTQRSFTEGVLLARVRRDPKAAVPLLREQVWAIDPTLPVRDAFLVGDRLEETAVQERFNAVLLSAFAALGGLLAVIGVYGVVSLAVGQRRRELGVRIALGAPAREILAAAAGRTMRALTVGLAVGLGAGLGLSRLVESLLFGVSPTDPGTYAGALALLGAVAAVACIVPARKALAVDPRETLREE